MGCTRGLGIGLTREVEQAIEFRRALICPGYHGVPHCAMVRKDRTVRDELEWGLEEAKVTYVVLGWVGITAGYRAPFAAPLKGNFLFGVAVVMSPAQVTPRTGL